MRYRLKRRRAAGPADAETPPASVSSDSSAAAGAEPASEVGQRQEEPATTVTPAVGADAPAPPADAVASPPLEVLAVPPDGVVLPAPDPTAPAGIEPGSDAVPAVPVEPAFRVRGRLRRRLRYLRRVRELGLRDLGGLLFDLHRFGREGDRLVAGKLSALTAVDVELRALEEALDDRRDLVVLREPGITACSRCAALHGSDANFCPNCGLPLTGARPAPGAGMPLAGMPAPVAPAGPQATAVQPQLDEHGQPIRTP